MKAASERSAALRAELEETLDAIEDKLNVPKQLGILGNRAKRSWGKNPVPWILGATAAVIAVGGIIALAVFREN